MRALADIADRFGTGELRLTVWQNLIIPNIPTEHLEAAQQALTDAGLNYKAALSLAALSPAQATRAAGSLPPTPSPTPSRSPIISTSTSLS